MILVKPFVEMVKIHKWFGKNHALKGVNFSVGHNEIVGLVGANDAGKSTLIKILSGFFPPDRGEMYFEGRKVEIPSPRDAMRLGIQTIYEDLALAEHMTIARNIFLGREPVRHIGPIRLLDLDKMREKSMEILRGIGLSIKSPDLRVKDLSEGEKQGVAIARAMYFKAKLLILDEPTKNLSVKETREVLRFVKELKEQGISSVFVTHNLYRVYPVADRLVVLSRGRKMGDARKVDASIEDLAELMAS